MSASLRKAYGETLVEIGKENVNVVALEADLGKSTMSCLFQDQFPERYFEMGIAEQNMASTAAGLSIAGKIPFYSSFAVFASGRAFDQIRQGICIPKLNVKICGSSSGLSDFGDGSTHQDIEDIAILRALPNMTVLVPADANETRKMVRAMAKTSGPMYIRINRAELPLITSEDGEFEIGKLYTVKEGKDAAVFANGIMVSTALAAADVLEKEGITVKVVNVSTVKPLDKQGVQDIVKDCRGIVTAEEHTVIGGLGSAIQEAMAGAEGKPVQMVGIMDEFGTSAHSYEELMVHYGLTADSIAAAVRKVLNR
jgi:transketolase